MHKKQIGISIFMIMFILFFIAGALAILPKVGMPYYNAEIIRTAIVEAVKNIPDDLPPVSVQTKIKENVNTRVSINNLSIDVDYLEIDKTGGQLTVNYDHVERNKLWEGAEVVVTVPIKVVK